MQAYIYIPIILKCRPIGRACYYTRATTIDSLQDRMACFITRTLTIALSNSTNPKTAPTALTLTIP